MIPPAGTTIYLVRHAESQANVRSVLSNGRSDDAALTARGRGQAERVAAWLIARGIAHLYYSPLRRATQTAAVIASALTLTPIGMETLREIDVGALDGSGDRATWDRHDTVIARWFAGEEDLAFPGGESLAQARSRGIESLETIAQRHPGERVAVIPHTMISRIAVARLAPIPGVVVGDRAYHLGHGQVGILQHDSDGWTRLAWDVRPRGPTGGRRRRSGADRM